MKQSKISRRSFLLGLGAVSAAAVLTACGGSSSASTAASGSAASGSSVVYRTLDQIKALPYMNVALGVISPDSNVITTLDNWNADDQMIVISGTTAETYLTKEYPDIPLQKYDSYATAKNALENGNGVAWANDNTEVIAFAKQNTGYTVGIPSLGSQDTIAPAVSQGNTTVLDWLNEEIKALGEENFFHKDYEETLVDTYGLDYEDELVVEGGVTGGADAASSEAASSEAASSEAAASEVASSAAAQ